MESIFSNNLRKSHEFAGLTSDGNAILINLSKEHGKKVKLSFDAPELLSWYICDENYKYILACSKVGHINLVDFTQGFIVQKFEKVGTGKEITKLLTV